MIVVKGKMPTKCYDCLTIGFDFENCPLNKSESADANTWMRCDHRHPDCPIVGEIPDEHGDLIDRDYVKKNQISLNDAPTILEASK